MTIDQLPDPNELSNAVHAAAPIPATLATVVLFADEGSWSAEVIAAFAENGIVVHLDPTGTGAFWDRGQTADAAIVDALLRARPATEVFAIWRGRSTGPLLAVAPRNADEATVLGAYAAGVDHVAPIDASPRQLIAHLRSLWRRLAPGRPALPSEPPLHWPVQLVDDAEVALIGGQEVALTSAEREFLQLLLSRNGRIVQRVELRASLGASDREVDFFVRRLRDKLERIDGRRRIVAVRGVGFRFDPGCEIEAGSTEPDLVQGGASV